MSRPPGVVAPLQRKREVAPPGSVASAFTLVNDQVKPACSLKVIGISRTEQNGFFSPRGGGRSEREPGFPQFNLRAVVLRCSMAVLDGMPGGVLGRVDKDRCWAVESSGEKGII